MSGDVRWPGAKQKTPDLELFPTFDDTLTTDVEDTVRNLPTLKLGRPHSEAERWQFKVVTDLTEEVKTLRVELGNVVRALDKKASLMAQAKFEKTLADRVDARIDKIRTIAMWAIGILLVVDGLIKVVH